MAKGNAQVDITGKDETGAAFKSAQSSLRNLASSAAILDGPLGGVAGRLNSIGAALGRVSPVTLTAGVALAAITTAVVSATREFAEYEQSLFRVNAVLTATSGIAGVTSQDIQDNAVELGRATLTSEKAALQASAALLRFTHVQNQFFTQTLSAAQDISAVFGGDLISNVTKVGRAIDNPRRGLNSLERELVTVTEAWKDNVIAMSDAGDEAGVAAAILGELNRTIGGAGTGEAGGLAGKLDTLGESWTRMVRNLGAISAVENATDVLTRLFDSANAFLDPTSLNTYNELIARQEADLRRLAHVIATSNQATVNGVLREVDARQVLIDQIAVQRKAAFDLEAPDRARAKALQDLDRQEKLLYKDEAALQALFTNNALAHLEHERKLLKAREAGRVVALALWEAALPPQEKLDKAYGRESQKLIELSKLGSITGRELGQALGAIDVKYEVDTKAQNVKDAKGPSRADQVREQLLREEAQIDLSYQRRALVIADASALLADDEIAKQEELQNTQLLLAQDYEQQLLELKVSKLTAYADAFSSVAGSLASYYEGHSRRLTDSINKHYNARADKVKESVKSGVLTEKEGNAQLTNLEKQRVQEQEKSAKKEFEKSKKLRRAEAIISTGAAIVGAMAGTHGDVYTRLAAGVAIGLAGALQVANINASQYEGGGSINTGGGSAGIAPVQSAPAEPQQNNNIVIVGNSQSSFSLEQVVGLIDSIREVSGRLDLTVVDSSSRNARDIRDAANGLVI